MTSFRADILKNIHTSRSHAEQLNAIRKKVNIVEGVLSRGVGRGVVVHPEPTAVQQRDLRTE